MKQSFGFLLFLMFILIGSIIFKSRSEESAVRSETAFSMENHARSVVSGFSNHAGQKNALLQSSVPFVIDSLAFSVWCDSFLIAQKGFVRSRNVYHFYQLIRDRDTSSSLWDFIIERNDCTGKYFKTGNRYIVCLENYDDFEYHHVFLIEKKINWKIIADSAFRHGNYSCCWEGTMGGFGFDRGYFYIDICGTGSAHCSQHRNIIEISGDSIFISEIPMNCFDGNYDQFNSTAKINVLSQK